MIKIIKLFYQIFPKCLNIAIWGVDGTLKLYIV